MPFCASISSYYVDYEQARFWLKTDEAKLFNLTFYRDELIDTSDIIVKIEFNTERQNVVIISQKYLAEPVIILNETHLTFKVETMDHKNDPMIDIWFKKTSQGSQINIVCRQHMTVLY